MRKYICILVGVFLSQLSFGSGHFIYLIKEDGVYGGAYDNFEIIEGADPKTFTFIDGWESNWGLVVTYAKDKNHVYHYTSVIENADPESFEILDKWYVKDKNHIYNAHQGHKIYEDYDASTFQIIGNWFIKDKGGVYYEHNLSSKAVKLDNIDPKTIEILWGTNYLKDRYNVYYYQEKGYGELMVKKIEDADPYTFIIDIPSSPYSRDAKNVYWNGEKLADANSNTFKLIMNTSYATDGRNIYYQSFKLLDANAEKFSLEDSSVGTTDRYVYYQGTKLEGIHPQNFILCSDYHKHYYIKNDSLVYYNSIQIKEADAATFEVTNEWRYEARDKNNRYKGGVIDKEEPVFFGIYESGVYLGNDGNKKLKGADPKTFQILNQYYGKDNKSVFCATHKIADADVVTFEIINNFMGKDKKAVYHNWNKIEGADPKTYTPLNSRYGKDKNRAFFDNIVIDKVHLISFKPINELYAKDKEHVFFQNIIIENASPDGFESFYPFSKDKKNVFYKTERIDNADPVTFKIFKNNYNDYSKDDKQVYYQKMIVEDADPETFKEFIGSGYWIDKNHVFYNGIKIENSDATTFMSLDGQYYQDKNQIYHLYGKINADKESFRILSKQYAIDKHHVYSNGSIVDGYDVNSFFIKDIYF